MKDQFKIRPVDISDAEEMVNIFAPYIRDTIISFEYYVPSIKDYEERIRQYKVQYPWLVCTINEKVIGFAYASVFRSKPAYLWSPESTIYMNDIFKGMGIGSVLYKTLFEILKLQGFYNVFAGITLPNPASVALHLSCGFKEIGLYENIGFKFDKWHSTQWYQLMMRSFTEKPENPILFHDVMRSHEFSNIIHHANHSLASRNQTS